MFLIISYSFWLNLKKIKVLCGIAKIFVDLVCCSTIKIIYLFFSLLYSSKSDGSVSILLIDLAVDVIHQVSAWDKNNMSKDVLQ